VRRHLDVHLLAIVKNTGHIEAKPLIGLIFYRWFVI
jgi:hypothetical protein